MKHVKEAEYEVVALREQSLYAELNTCVGVAFSRNGYGGLAHVLSPDVDVDTDGAVLNEFFDAFEGETGTPSNDLEVELYGGNNNSESRKGSRNLEVVRDYLDEKGISYREVETGTDVDLLVSLSGIRDIETGLSDL